MQIGSAEPLLASFLFVLSFYGVSFGGRGYVTVLRTDALQAPLDRARGELSSDTRTLIFHLKIIRGKIGEIWRSEIASVRIGYRYRSMIGPPPPPPRYGTPGPIVLG